LSGEGKSLIGELYPREMINFDDYLTVLWCQQRKPHFWCASHCSAELI